MNKISNSAIKYWDKMWKVWKKNKLGTPLNELATYCNLVNINLIFFFIKHMAYFIYSIIWST